jgi:hypothetical protein
LIGQENTQIGAAVIARIGILASGPPFPVINFFRIILPYSFRIIAESSQSDVMADT